MVDHKRDALSASCYSSTTRDFDRQESISFPKCYFNSEHNRKQLVITKRITWTVTY